MASEDEAKAALAKFRADPALFITRMFGVKLDRWQETVLAKVADPTVRRVAMQACAGVGKTATLAWIVIWFSATHPNAQVACVANSDDQLRMGLWKEICYWIAKCKPLAEQFVIGKSEIAKKPSENNPEQASYWWIKAKSYSKDADDQSIMQSLAGVHAFYCMFVLDEAGSMPRAVLDGACGIFSGADEGRKLLVMAGNPTHREGPLWHACVEDTAHWYVQRITARPGDPMRSSRVSEEEAQLFIDNNGGLDDPRVRSKILGEFPLDDPDGLFADSAIDAATSRYVDEVEYEKSAKILGVDVARKGGDLTVMFPRQGKAAFMPKRINESDQIAIANAVFDAYTCWGADAVCIDGSGGYGAGVCDILRSMGVVVHEIQFGGLPYDNRYVNKRTEMYFEIRSWLSGGCLPDIPELREELLAQTCSHQKNNDKAFLSPKDNIRRKLGRSPDYSDALALTFAVRGVQSSARSHSCGSYLGSSARGSYRAG